MPLLNNFEDIYNIFYINLEHREDRHAHVLNQLEVMGMKDKSKRFNAIKMINGIVGCGMSHLKILQNAHENLFDHILIMEDDITFIEPNTLKTQFNKFIATHKNNWDVILLGGNVIDFDDIDETCIKVNKCLCATGYLVNGHYIQTLINNIQIGLKYLIKRPLYKHLYAIDVFWWGLQYKDNWYLITPLTVTQMESYSDIEHKITNYVTKMTTFGNVTKYIENNTDINIKHTDDIMETIIMLNGG